ncbi:putative integral membrane protein [Mycobacteroides abscessus subsp. abscessus]|uniref:anthrone oxygenase family protein n=1 Tax=Mycobacteroides abscessus TaxID=36809 RepID=UPI0009A720E1|nr:anthrone oxygenase family protein [Mycobacteroides abscessus]SKU31936.1 putative integral membrane protein [Mycobacteroides abscessus subsp. abscessus]SKX80295.1 putative integral membrane protein [Mycobacteroides abscessus subsp. abscessus]
MFTSVVVILASVAAIANAAVGGIAYAFSTFVMRGLDRTDPVEAITAKQAINKEANSNIAFLLAVAGTAILSAAVGVIAATQLRQPGNWWLLAGAVFGVVAAIIAILFNVPLNNRLDGVDSSQLLADDAARAWHAYFTAWMAWNHVRTIAAFLGAALMLVALRFR